MKTSVSVEITPFSVPSFVTVKPFCEAPATPEMQAPPWAPPAIPRPQPYFEIPLAGLPGDALYALCADFETQVWNAAGKSRTVPARLDNTEARRAVEVLEDTLLEAVFTHVDTRQAAVHALKNIVKYLSSV